MVPYLNTAKAELPPFMVPCPWDGPTIPAKYIPASAAGRDLLARIPAAT